MKDSQKSKPKEPKELSKNEKILQLTKKFNSFDKDSLKEIKETILNDSGFIDFCLNKTDWTFEEHDALMSILEPIKSEGYYQDLYGSKVSYNGIKTLKKPNTELNLSEIHLNEIDKCSQDFKYFRKYYCKIQTKNGIQRPEPREYQAELENTLINLEDTAVSFSRQSGKCVQYDTLINIKNKQTGEIERIKIGEFYERINEIQQQQSPSWIKRIFGFIKSGISTLWFTKK